MARFSVVVSALDERADLGRSLRAISRAAHAVHTDPEVVVVVGDEKSAQADIAAAMGASVVAVGPSSTIAGARNAGARVATGQVLVVIDAQRVMSPVAFAEIERLLATGCYVGGGAIQHPELHRVGIQAAAWLSRLTSYLTGLGGGMYWCRHDDFDAIGGFDDRVNTLDDLDFARRLRDHGLRTGRKFVNLRQAPVTTSCRQGAPAGNAYAFGR